MHGHFRILMVLIVLALVSTACNAATNSPGEATVPTLAATAAPVTPAVNTPAPTETSPTAEPAPTETTTPPATLGPTVAYNDPVAHFAVDYPAHWSILDVPLDDKQASEAYAVTVASWDLTAAPGGDGIPEGQTKLDFVVMGSEANTFEGALAERKQAMETMEPPETILAEERWTLAGGLPAARWQVESLFGQAAVLFTFIDGRVVLLSGLGDYDLFDQIARTLHPWQPDAQGIQVRPTDVQYVMAQQDVTMYAGPGGAYDAIGQVFAGQIALVTGSSPDGNWWRVSCPDDTVGDCWLNADPRFTEPASAPSAADPPPATATPAGLSCTDAAAFIADVTIPDNSLLEPGTGFVKTWRIRNSGSCTWDNRYSLVHVGGDLLGAITNRFPLPGVVAPGQTVDLSVSLVSPAAAGHYLSEWKLSAPQGSQFGVGYRQNPLWAEIRVGAETASIAGWLWHDHCFVHTGSDGYEVVDGHCLSDGFGGYRADGMISPDEENIAGVTILLQSGACATGNPVIAARAVTDQTGRYVFDGLPGGTYCVLMNAVEDGNAALLLPGDWTFPANGIWYQQISVGPGEQASPVNFGWDYQLN